jgi:adenylate cyclase
VAKTTSTPAFLKVFSPENDRVIKLEGPGPWRIGRGSANEIDLGDVKASREHGMFQHTGGNQFIFLDLGSRNGSYINKRRVTVLQYLSHGDELTIGSHRIVVNHPGRASNVEVEERAAKDLDATIYHFAVHSIAVLVVDIRGFTRLSQKVDESVLARTVGTWVAECGRVLEDCGSWSQKYIGDAVMSIWLMEGSRQDRWGVIVNLLTALERIVAISSKLHEKFDLPGPVTIGAGVNNGLASLGNVRSESASDYTALGDSVNLAFRLESATRTVGVDLLIGPGTVDELGDHPGLEQILEKRSVKLKGYSVPVTTYSASFDALPSLIDSLSKANGGDPL